MKKHIKTPKKKLKNFNPKKKEEKEEQSHQKNEIISSKVYLKL